MEITNGTILYATSLDADGLPVLESLRNLQSGYDWAAKKQKCGIGLGLDSSEAGLSSPWREDGLAAPEIEADHHEYSVTFTHQSGCCAVQTISCFNGYDALRFRCSVGNGDGSFPLVITDLSPLHLPLKAVDGLKIYTIRRDRYCLETTIIGQEPVVIRGGLWNRVEHAGWLVLEDPAARECMYIGVEWEREWELAVQPTAAGLSLSFRLVSFSRQLDPGETAGSPSLFIGLSHGDLDDASNQMRAYLTDHVFPAKLADFPWVSYDIWSTDGSGVESALRDEMSFSADLGIDLFYIDASWWAGSSVLGTGAWGLGLGCYDEDRRKFPAGLRDLSNRAHNLGMKFGLWVDPMIVDAAHVIKGLIPASWLIQEDGVDSELRIGQPDWPPVKQLCTGCPDVVQYLIDKLSGIIRKYNLDWLKWDDSALAYPCCNRTDHGHGSRNGNQSAVQGKYAVCAALLEKFPNLVIEQCGYPARLDYGLASYVRSNWLSDASTPSVHVRNNMEIACYIYPASYNAAWILKDQETLNETDPAIVDAIVRSRMMGLFGLGTLTGQLSERISLLPQPILEGIRRNIPLYKGFRHLLSQNAWHLSPYVRSESEWQAMEFSARDCSQAVALIFRGASLLDKYDFTLRGLDADSRYKIVLIDAGKTWTLLGRELMENGLTINLAAGESSEIVLVTIL